jgi:hypothetical protein
MLKIKEFQEINHLTGILDNSLNMTLPGDIPKDVIEAIVAAKKQMEELPQVVEDLNQAFNRYLTLNKTLSRMSQLAREAALKDEGPAELEVRKKMESEFAGLAKVVASEAGQHYFPGSSLSILTKNKAKASAKVLSFLDPVLENLDHELKGQKNLIIEAIAETMNFLVIITVCYPHTEGIENIKTVLDKIRLPKSLEEPVILSPTIH